MPIDPSTLLVADRPNLLSYVLITPARNEERYIGHTLRAVERQTVRPLRWIVVSDGSTDGTDAIVQSFVERNDWMELLRLPVRAERHFAGKVNAFNAGWEKLRHLRFDIVGSLDADLSFDEGYFAYLLEQFANCPKLGVAGTPFTEEGVHYDFRFASVEHVSGACQLFRRECFEAIGGYTPLKVGGIDLVAVTTARMQGWTTRTFTEKVSVHHKMTQTGQHSSVRAGYKSGFHDYLMGSHPLWQVARWARGLLKSPLLGTAIVCGFFWAATIRAERPVSADFVRFRRREQMRRLGRILIGSS